VGMLISPWVFILRPQYTTNFRIVQA
jgi:hypothetical protein